MSIWRSGWSWPTSLQRAARWFPQSCELCSADADEALCAGCRADLPLLTGPRCRRCALPTGGAELCGRCLADPPDYDATIAALAYSHPAATLIQRLKYAGRLHLAGLLADTLTQAPEPVADLLLPVPLHTRRLAQRGYNQSVEIARHLARRWRLPLATDLCVRLVDNAPQASRPWKERQRNVRGIFHVVTDLRRRHVAVVDDVMTTGATLHELAGVLKEHGAARVTNLVAARTLIGT